jgi:hypothetical protein
MFVMNLRLQRLMLILLIVLGYSQWGRILKYLTLFLFKSRGRGGRCLACLLLAAPYA